MLRASKIRRSKKHLQGAVGLVVDLRGNPGGGFDAPTLHVSFYLDEKLGDLNRP